MNHYSVTSKSGDQLCPLGFHPQVRWPTRCKRCFRDYKEHGSRRIEDVSYHASTPALDRSGIDKSVRSWTSTQNLSSNNNNNKSFDSSNVVEVTAPLRQRPSSWSSTPDLDDAQKKFFPKPVEEVTVSLQLPIRRRPVPTPPQTTSSDQVEESFTLRRPSTSTNGNVSPAPPSPSTSTDSTDSTVVINKTDSLAERVRKMQMMKRQGSQERESSIPRNEEPKSEIETQTIRRRRQTDPLPPIPDEKPVRSRQNSTLPPVAPRARSTVENSSTVSEKPIANSLAVKKVLSRTTSDSRVDSPLNENVQKISEENELLRRELETLKTRCEKVEREKSDILLRRLASVDSTANRTAASEVLKLQQKVNEMSQKIEDLEDEKKSMSSKLRNLTSKSIEETLRSKLEQAEKMCESLMDENEEMKKELKNMESEMDELQDNFREEQADDYVTKKRELDQANKNCRVLSFKLKKSEKRIEQLELEKQAGGGNNSNIDLVTKIKQLEDELKVSNEVARRLQSESDSNSSKKKAPTLGKIGKSTSDGGTKVSRESLTRGGSQEDPAQLLRDLQDSIEREADIREQLKFAEEEAESLRKKSSRVEDENESLLMQVKKMASSARKRLRSPNPTRNSVIEKDEGISDEEDTTELKLQLELNEREASVLRRKVEDLEKSNELNKRQITDLQEKLVKAKETSKGLKLPLSKTSTTKDPLNEKKIQVLEDEINELRKKLLEKDRDIVRIEAESSLKGKSKLKSKSDSIQDSQTIDIKRQLQVVEQEASVLRTKTQTLEQENENLLAEVKRLQVNGAKTNGLSQNSKELENLKKSVTELEKERDELRIKVRRILDDSVDKLPKRTPKIFSDMKTKLQLKRMIEELEEEVTEMRAIAVRVGAGEVKKLEDEKSKLNKELSELKTKNEEINNKKDVNKPMMKEIEVKLQASLSDNKIFTDKIQKLEEKLNKQEEIIKQMETTKMSFELQVKGEKDKSTKMEKEFEKLKIDKAKWETKAQAVEAELSISKKSSEKAKKEFEKEILNLKEKSKNNDEFPSKMLHEIQEKNKELEIEVQNERKRNSEFSSKYELLEEEHVLFKAQLSTENEKLEAEIKSLKAQITKLKMNEDETQSEKQSLKTKISDLQRKLTEAEIQGNKTSSTIDLEKSRLKSKLDEKEQEYSKLVKQNEMNLDQLSSLRKDNDDLRRKLDDFERINKAQRSLNDHNATLENELKKLKVKLESSEMAVKSEVASTRLRYETQANTLQNELSSVHRQCERFKKDRDSYKQLLEAAQKNIADLKQNQNRKSYTSTSSGDEDDKSKLHLLEQQVGNLEDELSESRLEASKIRTEMISEKTSFEIKIAEMQSKLNEYEEERILSKSKVPGTRSRLELSWQKERDEQQRLLAETSTLARDLRQTLFEVERERDKERLESRRKIDQIKKATEEELEEGRRKISELQSDLLDLRDAHAKLRTANEKIRRDRDRLDREPSSSKRRLEQVGERKVGALLQQVDELVKIAPEMIQNKNENASQTLSIPNTQTRNKSRSPSPSPSTASTMQISTVLARLAEASEELRRFQRIAEEERERERNRRSGMRRAASQENDGLDNSNSMNRPIARVSRQGSLYRKSLSLDQSMQSEQPQAIWKVDSDAGSMSSMQSLDSEYGIRRGDVSVDSRISVGSTQSDMPGRRKKKKGIMGKLRSLASRGTESDASQHGSDSDLSLAGDHSSKKDLKDRISGIFKRAGSSSRASSRAGSQEKILLNDSSQRPVSIASHGSSNTLPTNFTLQQVQAPLPKTKPPTPNSQRKLRPKSKI